MHRTNELSGNETIRLTGYQHRCMSQFIVGGWAIFAWKIFWQCLKNCYANFALPNSPHPIIMSKNVVFSPLINIKKFSVFGCPKSNGFARVRGPAPLACMAMAIRPVLVVHLSSALLTVTHFTVLSPTWQLKRHCPMQRYLWFFNSREHLTWNFTAEWGSFPFMNAHVTS